MGSVLLVGMGVVDIVLVVVAGVVVAAVLCLLVVVIAAHDASGITGVHVGAAPLGNIPNQPVPEGITELGGRRRRSLTVSLRPRVPDAFLRVEDNPFGRGG